MGGPELFTVQGSRFKVHGAGSRFKSSRFKELKVQEFKVHGAGSRFGVRGSGSRVILEVCERVAIAKGRWMPDDLLRRVRCKRMNVQPNVEP
jgi:hypothetical protein